MDYAKESLRLHGEWKGKIEVVTTVPVGRSFPGLYSGCSAALSGDPEGCGQIIRSYKKMEHVSCCYRRFRSSWSG